MGNNISSQNLDNIASDYLNKRKAILMSTNKVKLPSHLQKRIRSSHPTSHPRPHSILSAPTQTNDTPNSINFSQCSYRTGSSHSIKNSIPSQSSSGSSSGSSVSRR